MWPLFLDFRPFNWKTSVKSINHRGSEAQTQRLYKLLWMLWFDEKSISSCCNFSLQLTEKVPRYPHQMFGNDYADCNVNLAQKPYFQRPLLNLRSHFVKLKIYCWTILFISQLLKITHVLIRYSKWDFNLQKILFFFKNLKIENLNTLTCIPIIA